MFLNRAVIAQIFALAAHIVRVTVCVSVRVFMCVSVSVFVRVLVSVFLRWRGSD